MLIPQNHIMNHTYIFNNQLITQLHLPTSWERNWKPHELQKNLLPSVFKSFTFSIPIPIFLTDRSQGFLYPLHFYVSFYGSCYFCDVEDEYLKHRKERIHHTSQERKWSLRRLWFSLSSQPAVQEALLSCHWDQCTTCHSQHQALRSAPSLSNWLRWVGNTKSRALKASNSIEAESLCNTGSTQSEVR